MIRGAVFDMDGTLVDNSAVHVRAFEIFCERYGVHDWQEKLAQAFGMGNDDIMRRIMPEEIIRQKGLAALADEKEAIYREIYAPTIRPVEGLADLLGRLRAVGVRLAVGSSGCRTNIDFVLEKCGIEGCFDVIVSGDRVAHCKPDPEIYLTAAAELGLNPVECVVFEDAKAGIESARRAGAGRIVALTTTLPREVLAAETAADMIVNNFAEVEDLGAILQ
ncbi:MAG: HAD family phosphatase [Alistipes sp.]|jgi:beta-phosphoglucomutase|uniref:HAD family hydrolase n=1 Tax=uncultured Alistipes sp. TaxID=538949 RepID=UPI0025992FE3|nr:HAD family phosphatase [uncultured Alistipes sp.]MCI9244446.1 HAD family phosphatase [Alistipes sp.]